MSASRPTKLVSCCRRLPEDGRVNRGATMSKGKYPVLAKGSKFLPVSVPYKTGNLVIAFKFL